MLGNHIVARTGNTLPQQAGEEQDWKFAEQLHEDMAKQLCSTADEFWQKMSSSSDFVKDVGQKTPSKFEFTEDDFGGWSKRLRLWILTHSVEFATLLACIAAGPIAMGLTPAMLGLLGFTPIGIAAGSVAASIYSSIGQVAARSAFAILTSAGIGSHGLMIVEAIAACSAVSNTCSAAALAMVHVFSTKIEGGNHRRALPERLFDLKTWISMWPRSTDIKKASKIQK